MPVVLATELKNQFIKGDAKGYVSQNLFFLCTPWFICLSFISATEKKESFQETMQKKKKKRERKRGPGNKDAPTGSE